MIERGNAHADGAAFGHWFIGNFAEWARTNPAAAGIRGLRQATSVEIKWGFHPAGESRIDWAPCSDKQTLSLLVHGEIVLRFRPPGDRQAVTEIRLEREGDYALWGPETEHTWIIEQDAVILTVRWRETV